MVSALSSVTFVQTKAKSRRVLLQIGHGQPEKGNPFADIDSSQAGSAVEMLTDLLNRSPRWGCVSPQYVIGLGLAWYSNTVFRLLGGVVGSA